MRTLGVGERAEIHLGHAGAREPPESDRVAAIKVFRPHTPEASIDSEIGALARTSSRHLLELRDIATGADGRPCLILPRLGSGTLARLLALRGTIRPGEAVTLLVPLVEAVRELHRVGVAHGAVRTSSVLFDDHGAPVLARFGGASLLGEFTVGDDARSLTAAQLDEEPRVLDDRRGLAVLVGAVLDRLGDGGSTAAVLELRRTLDAASAAPERLASLGDRLAELLFDLAPALPVRFEGALGQGASASEPARVGLSAPIAGPIRLAGHPLIPDETMAGEPNARGRGQGEFGADGFGADGFGVDGFGADGFGVGAFSGDPRHQNPFLALRDRLLHLLAPVRKSFWIAGGAGAGALVLALTVVPSAHWDTPGRAPGSSAPVASASDGAAPRASTGSAPTGLSGAPEPTAAPAPLSGNAADIAGEDPLAAARALLAERALCFTKRAATCFAGVDQAGSAVLEADRELVRRLKAGAALPVEATLDGFTPHLVQQLGDSAIIQLIAEDGSVVAQLNPAPLLVVRSGAGWRIRDLSVG